jgi:hypothetical protein
MSRDRSDVRQMPDHVPNAGQRLDDRDRVPERRAGTPGISHETSFDESMPPTILNPSARGSLLLNRLSIAGYSIGSASITGACWGLRMSSNSKIAGSVVQISMT